MDGLTLLREAKAAGLSVSADGGLLTIRGPKDAEPVARLLLERKPEVLAALAATRDFPSGAAVRIHSLNLDAELWIAPDPTSARDLEDELVAHGDRRVVLTAADAIALGRMLEADARAIFAALSGARPVLGGSVVCVGERGCYDA